MVFYILLASLTLSGMTYASYGYSNQTRKDYYNQWGQHEGYSQQQSHTNRTDHYDQWGRHQGYSQQQSPNQIDHYDQWGRYQGSTK